MREAFFQAFRFTNAPPAVEFAFEGDSGAGAPHRTIQIAFSSAVDRSSQMRNRDGAMIGGPASWLLGAITPWSCPVTHMLRANLSAADGTLLHSCEITRKEKNVGTMLMCPDVEHPGKDEVRDLTVELLQRMSADGLLLP